MLTEIRVTTVLPSSWHDVVLYRLEHDVTVGTYAVPAGFVTDGASVPRWLWSVFPPVGRYFVAACLHDHALQAGKGWQRSNDLFAYALARHDIKGWRHHAMLTAVRLNGWWQRVRHKLGMEARHVRT